MSTKPVAGVTVTLSGDASDSVQTNASGEYSFDLPNGDYVVTPAKADYQFTPASESVTIADGDDTDNDFTGAEIYSISGDIVDGAAAGIEGVLVTLSGDADDTDTTDSNGHYEFTGLVDGSYTVTPTLANLQMTPASRAANVSGDDVAVDDIVGQYLALPYTYNMSSVAETSGAVAGQLSDWTVFAGRTDGEITTSVADSNSYTPAGVTKGFIVEWNATRDGIINNLPYSIDPAFESIRFAFLQKAAEANRSISFWLNNLVDISGNSLYSIYPDPNVSPDRLTSTARYGDATLYSELSDTGAGGDIDNRRYHWVRAEWNFIANTVSASIVRAEDSSVIDTASAAMNAAGQSYNHVSPDMEYMMFSCQLANATPTIVKFWIGTASDAWLT